MLTVNPIEDNRINDDAITIRQAVKSDASAIAAIFNHSIVHSTASFYMRPRTITQQTHWLIDRSQRFPVFAAVVAGQVVGWASLDPWSDRQGYRGTCEVSYYVDAEFHRRGVGRRLVATAVQTARDFQFRNVIARITEGNEASFRIIEQFGFRHVGTLVGVGEKFGTELDVAIYQKQFSDSPQSLPDVNS